MIVVHLFISLDPSIARSSLHPPHLTETKGLPTLIPFCAYGGNTEILGEYVQGLYFPVCNAFKPTILDGEVCYTFDFKRSKGSMVSRAGRGKGLLLAIDNGISVEPQQEKDIMEIKKGFIRTELVSAGKRARLRILTSYRYKDSRPGTYMLKDLKQMTGTDNFLGMRDNIKKCQIEPKEECRSRRYLQEVQRICGCIPWSLSTFVAYHAVSFNISIYVFKVNFYF